MTTEHTEEAPAYAARAETESNETLSPQLVVLLHLLPGALLMGGVLLLAPPLIERGVPYDLVHILSALLTMVPFIFGAMLLYGRRRHGHLTLMSAPQNKARVVGYRRQSAGVFLVRLSRLGRRTCPWPPASPSL